MLHVWFTLRIAFPLSVLVMVFGHIFSFRSDSVFIVFQFPFQFQFQLGPTHIFSFDFRWDIL